MSDTDDPHAALATLWSAAQGDPAALAHASIAGRDPALPSVYRCGTAAAATIAAAALAAAELWRLRTGRRQQVTVDMRAAAAAFRSERYLRINGSSAPEIWGRIAGFYETGDGRWIQLHTNFPHHRDGVLKLLGAADDRQAVQAAIKGWQGQALEDALAAAGMCAGLVRAPTEWAQHPQAAAVATLPLFEIVKLGDSPPEPLPSGGDRPLAGLRALDLSRIIAGPVAGRELAAHGADVLLIAGPHPPSIGPLVIDTGRGKLSAQLDLRQAAGRDRLRALLGEADIFLQAYRPGALAGRGFGPGEAAALRPGIVYVTLSAFGHAGPWRQRRGFDSLVQSVSGIAWTGGDAVGSTAPKHLPCQALDHATGFLAAFGAMMALQRRAREGGSWLVRVSLAQTGRWFDGLGRVAGGAQAADQTRDDVADLLTRVDSPFGAIECVAPGPWLSETLPSHTRPPVPLGTHAPAWPAR
jgi:crotonobetainyl-CoA:carnitine CoA-transferase CaiB-like acyl-CoA transferase